MTRTRWLTAALAACLVTFGAVASAEDAPDNWDGLVQVKPKRMDLVYVLPGADFRPYTKVMLDKTEVAFRKDWLKNMNDTRTVSRKIDDDEAAKIMAAASSNFSDVWTKALDKAGYQVVATPGPDVLRLSTCDRRPLHQRTGHDGSGPGAYVHRRGRRSDADPRSARFADECLARARGRSS